MRAVVVVVGQPFIQVDLQFFDRTIDLAPERYLIELIENRLVEALADTIGLRMVCLGLRVFYSKRDGNDVWTQFAEDAKVVPTTFELLPKCWTSFRGNSWGSTRSGRSW